MNPVSTNSRNRPAFTSRRRALAFSLMVGACGLVSPVAGAADGTVRQISGIAALAGLLVLLLLVALHRRNHQLAAVQGALDVALADDNPLLAALPDLVALKDVNGRYLTCNEHFTAIFGESTNVVGKTDFDLLGIQDARRWRNHERQAAEMGVAIDVEEWLSLPDRGFTALLRTTRRPVYKHGRLIGVLTVSRDVTQLRLAEQQASRQQSYQRALLDNLPYLAWMKDTEGRFLAVNDQLIAASSIDSRNDIIGKTDFDLWPRKLAEAYQADDRAVMRARAKKEVVEQVAGEDGPVWVETFKAPIIGEHDELLGTVGFSRDVSQRLEAERAVRDSERRLRESFQKHAAMMLFIDPQNGRISDANEAAIAFYGYRRDQLLAMTVDELNTLPPRAIAQAREQAWRGSHNHFEFEHRLASGERRMVEVYSSTIEHDGKPQLMSIIHDITERKQAQQALEHERDLFSAGPVVVFSWSPQPGWPVASVSRNCREVLGYTPEQLIGSAKGIDELLHPDDRDRVSNEIERYLADGHDRFEQSYRVRRADGSYAWFHDFTHVVRDETGEIAGLRGYLFDETQIKRLELSLADQRQRLSNVIEGTGVGTWEWNVQTGETRFNERWAEIIGYRLDELMPVTIDTWLQHAHPGDLAQSEALLKQHFAGETVQYEFEARMRHRDGHWVWVLDRGRVFEWTDDGQPLWMYGTHQDISERKLIELRLRENEQRLQIAGKTAYDIVYEYDVEHGRLDWYGDVVTLLGYTRDQTMSGIDQWLDKIHPDDRERVAATLNADSGERNPLEQEYRVRHADGGYRLWRDRAHALRNAQGLVTRWIANCTDVTERRANENRQRLAATVFDYAHEGIMICDADTRIVDVNAAFTKITGYSRDEAIGQRPSFLSSGHQDPGFYEAMWATLNREDHWTGEVWNRRKDGNVYAEMLAISTVRDDRGNVQRYVALFSDITTIKKQQEQLSQIAYYDALTDLPNRVLLGDRLRNEMRHANRNGKHIAVVFLDLDGFKQINDRFGHGAGDRALIDVANRLRKTLREDDTIARLGGDEFVAILPGLNTPTDCVALLPRLQTAAAQPLHIQGHTLNLSASLGVALYPQAEPLDSDQLLRQADQAMYQAKLAGKNCYQFFDDEYDRNVRGRLEQIEQIRQAIIDDAFELHYQPKVNMRSGELVGVEALIRWPQADGGMRMPLDFLPFIDNHVLASELDEWVLHTALKQLATWQTEGLTTAVSVNISAFHLQRDDFCERLNAVLAEHPAVAPERLTIEVLESNALRDLNRVSATILEARRMGVRFALDDFGTGYSSLSYLKNLPAHELKIDRAFVRDMLDDSDDLAILEGVVGLSAAFRRELVAEGVESVAQGELLIALGCDVAQGFGIGKPMPAAKLAAWAASWSPDPRWRQARPVAREDLPLIFAIADHGAWVAALKSQLNGRQLPMPEMDESRCQFAQWLHGEGHRRYRDSARFVAIDRLHHEVHRLGPSIITHHASGRADDAQRELHELLTLRDALFGELRALLDNPAG